MGNNNKRPNKFVFLEAGFMTFAFGVIGMIFYPCMTCSVVTFVGAMSLALYATERSKFDKIWFALGLGINGAYPIERRREKMDGYTLYEFAFPAGLCSEDFIKHELAIREWLGKEIEIDYGHKNLFIKVYDQEFRHNYDFQFTKAPGDVPILIGHDRSGKLIFADLASGEPHMVIAGETGSGKSTSLRSIIVNLIFTAQVDLYLIDLKYGAELGMFKRCHKVKGFARTRDEAEALLQQIRDEVARRYNLFSDAGCTDIKAYRTKRGRALRYQVLIVDEFADLMQEKKSTRLIEELTAMARACGIHIILSTQRPDAKVLNGRVKANCATVLGLKTMNDINSRIIIDDVGLDALAGKGHGLFKRAGELTEVQVPYLSQERAIELVTPFSAAPPPTTQRKPPKKKNLFEELQGEE